MEVVSFDYISKKKKKHIHVSAAHKWKCKNYFGLFLTWKSGYIKRWKEGAFSESFSTISRMLLFRKLHPLPALQNDVINVSVIVCFRLSSNPANKNLRKDQVDIPRSFYPFMCNLKSSFFQLYFSCSAEVLQNYYKQTKSFSTLMHSINVASVFS